jgi:DNA repair protein RadC
MQEQEAFKLEVVSVRLVKDAPLFSDHRITSPEDAVKAVGDFLCEMDREVLCVINLKSDGTPINCSIVSIGAVNQTIAEPRELFKASILSNAAKMILVHNHPSGRLEPSRQDTMLTDRMLKLTDLMGITLKDHVIVGGDNSQYFSFHEKGLLEHPKIYLSTDYNALEFGSTTMVAEKGRAR